MAANPHLETGPLHAGVPLGEARAAAVLVHGRDQEPAYMLAHLARRLDTHGVAWILPVAAERSWYPGRFFDPPSAQEPWLTHALDAYDATLAGVEAAGVPLRRTVLVGFSQGACLVAELAVGRPRPFGGVAILTGALMGSAKGRQVQPGSLEGVPALVAGATRDPWIPPGPMRETARALERAGADVTLRLYDEREHHINDDEARLVGELVAAAAGRGDPR
jgi:predicted esterase